MTTLNNQKATKVKVRKVDHIFQDLKLACMAETHNFEEWSRIFSHAKLEIKTSIIVGLLRKINEYKVTIEDVKGIEEFDKFITIVQEFNKEL